jgi:DNA-binding MarR family transcriptional regulator
MMRPAPDQGGRSEMPEIHYRALIHERISSELGLDRDTADRADVVYSLSKLVARLSQDYESLHRRLGWSWVGFRLRNLIWAGGPVEASRLGRANGQSRAALASALSTLERGGFIARRRSAEDRRQIIVDLTELGESRVREGVTAQAQRDASWFAVLTDAEQEQLGSLLRRLADQPQPPRARPGRT